MNRWRRSAALLMVLSVMEAASLAGAQEPEPGFDIVAPPARDVTPPGVTPGPAVEGPLIREKVPPPPPDPARWHRFFLPKTSDAATFHVEGRTIHIAGVSPPAIEAMCKQDDGKAWPCGHTALYALRMFLRGRAIECFFPHADTAVEITAPCRVGATDLGLWLLSQGWARPGDYATEDYDAAAAARCAGRGIWRGVAPDAPCDGSAKG